MVKQHHHVGVTIVGDFLHIIGVIELVRQAVLFEHALSCQLPFEHSLPVTFVRRQPEESIAAYVV